jgi:PAS domain S-box-containing protein
MLDMPQMQDAKLSDEALSTLTSLGKNVYDGLFEHMNYGFAYCKVIFDEFGNAKDYVFYDMNKLCRKLARLHKPVVGRKATELFSTLESEPLKWIKKCGKVAHTGKSLTFESAYPALNRWFSISAYCPEKDHFVMIIKDITGRKRTEQALRQSERQYRKIAKSITDPFFALDSSLKINYWNKTIEKLTGIGIKEVVNKHYFDVFGKSKATKKFVKVFLSTMHSKKPRTWVGNLPNCDGEFFFEIQVYPTGDGISVLLKDVTERRKLQDSLEQYAKRLEEVIKIRTERMKGVERLAAIGETAGMVGHDIRNPLQTIICELFLAKEEINGLPECEARKNLTSSINCIEKQTMYINKIVTDLQDYAKPLTATIQETCLEEIIQDVLSELDAPENVSVSYKIKKSFPMLKVDPSFLKRILVNLVRNGIQAMEEKGGNLTISAFRRENAVIIAVSDTGKGMTEEVKSRIFKPLFTTKSKGQGFGLAVVKKLSRSLGWKCKLRNHCWGRNDVYNRDSA